MLPSTLAESSGDALVVLPLPALRPDHTARAAALLASSSTALSTSSSTSSANVAAAAGLRSANRAAQSGLNASRARAADARVQADAADVALRTAEYELARVRDETAKCAAYEPLYERLEFVSEEEFMAGAGEEVVGAFPDDDEARKYALVVARLEAELAAVLAAEARVAELTAERDGLVRARRAVKHKFDAVDIHLADFAKTSNGLANKLRDVAKATAPTPKAPAAVLSAASTPAASPAADPQVPAGPPAP